MSVDLDKFQAKLIAAFDGKAAGWQYFIRDLSRPYEFPRMWAGGYAVKPHDAGAYPVVNASNISLFLNGVPQSITKPMETMSLSKTITAAAAVKLISNYQTSSLPPYTKQHLSWGKGGLDAPIFPFLPADWKLGSNIMFVTFRNLLRHQTIFQEYKQLTDPFSRATFQDSFVVTPLTYVSTGRVASKFDNMRKSVATGLPCRPDEMIEASQAAGIAYPYMYQNMNFGLFRVLIPYLLNRDAVEQYRNEMVGDIDDVDHISPQQAGAQRYFEIMLGARYAKYVRDHILGPAGIPSAYLHSPPAPDGTVPTRYYDSTTPDELPRSEYADPVRVAGGTDWKLSAEQYGRFMIALVSGSLGSKVWPKMYRNKFGLIDRTEVGAEGVVSKDGDGADSGTVHTGWIFAPKDTDANSGVVAVAQINSDLKDTAYEKTSVSGVLTKAYLES